LNDLEEKIEKDVRKTPASFAEACADNERETYSHKRDGSEAL
jgi:hypothetical protein